jgi:aldose 1-epimerase
MIVLEPPATHGAPCEPPVQLRVDAERGGRIAGLRVGSRELLVGIDHERPDDEQWTSWGSFPMAPWAGRVRHGRFSFDGREHRLEVNLPPHAIHGTVFHRPWTVDLIDGGDVEMSIELGWELGGTAHQRISVDHRAVRCELKVTAADQAMPVELGWHPWFLEPDELEFHPTQQYRRDADGIPDGTLVAPGPRPWDDCFVGADRAVLRYGESDDELTVTVTTDCDHWVVYTEPVHATCVEPQTGPPDAFTIRPRALAPGGSLTRWMRWSW